MIPSRYQIRGRDINGVGLHYTGYAEGIRAGATGMLKHPGKIREIHRSCEGWATTNVPPLAAFIWVGGGSIGLIILIVVIVLVLRR
jgi:hypothetical protein